MKKIYYFIVILILLFESLILAQYDNYYNNGFNFGINQNPYNPNYNPYTDPYNPSNDPYYNRYNPRYDSYPEYYNRYDNGNNIYGDSVNPQFYPPGYSGFNYISPNVNLPSYGSYECVATQDLILQIAPGGCSPPVVRSDLLEEQNVPVFCKVMGIQVNPLIDISRIRSIRIKGQYPKGVSGISYYPARVAVGGKLAFDNSIFDDNLGYVVIVLSRQPDESAIPEFIEGNISAVVDYITEASFGIGEPSFYLSPISDEQWISNYRDYGFWNGKAYLRVEAIENDLAHISVYRDINTKQTTVSLKQGQTSRDIFLTGFYCGAGLRIKVDKISIPVDSALLQVNGVQSWISKGDKIMNDKCRVVDLEAYHGGGKIKINCPGKELTELSLSPGNAVFSSSSVEFFDVVIGENIEDHIYLAYMGQAIDNRRYAILIKDDSSPSAREFREKKVIDIIAKTIKEEMSLDEIKKSMEDSIKKHYNNLGLSDKISIGIIAEGEEFSGIKLNNVNTARDKLFDYQKITAQQKLARDYYELSINEYENLINLYPSEKMEYVEEDPYAAKSLLESARLSRTLGMDGKSYEFYNKLINEYSNSQSTQAALVENRNLLKFDTTKSQISLTIMNENYFVSLLDFKIPDKSDLSAVIFINGEEKTLGLKDSTVISKDNYAHIFKTIGIEDNYVDIEYERRGGNLQTPEIKKQRLRTDKAENFNGVNVRLIRTNLNKQVKITVLSRGYGPQTESHFKFRIGIEKRAIKISPERAKEMIKNLRESIEMWDNINRKLGNVIRGLKSACFATSAVLTAKNVITGSSGASLARNLLMTNKGGWNEKCEELVNRGQYNSVQQCLLAHSNEIENDVNIYSNEIQNTNNIIKKIKDKLGIKQGILGDEKVDFKKVEEEFKKVFEDWCKNKNDKITLPDKDKTILSLDNSDKSICKWETLTHEQRRDIMTIYNLKQAGGSETLQNFTQAELSRNLLEIKDYNIIYNDIISSEKDANKYNLSLKTTDPVGDVITNGYIKTITINDNEHTIYKNFKEGDKVVRIFVPKEKSFGSSVFKIEDETIAIEIGGKQVIVEVSYSEDDNYYYPKENGKVFLVDGTLVSKSAADEVRRYMQYIGLSKIKQSDIKAYKNRMLHPEKLIVKYFERAPYKGLPAEVPFDIENGWYTEMTYVISGIGKPYDESGRVINFYICNVGTNGLIEFKQSADDICRYYNENIPDINFPGLSDVESSALVEKARRAIADAARQYGKSKVLINGRSFDSGISFGGEEGRCTDFMSVKDCSLLYNVCDPVICPASRCDFGGKYRVDNVIQSGVAGSLLLCLPNYKEGVVLPICLSGVHAGIQGYTSILNSTADCLNESITTGRNVGICDEVKSIYMCEFFWRQAVPLAKITAPRIFEGISGQGRGGGEYLTIQKAWDNAQNAASYFTQVYALNSVRAFTNRNIDYAGGDLGINICKSFISANFGGVKGLFKALIEPDSPVQYHAWFSETPLTTATVPPTSHYKVYYHIYSGNDIGAYYVVYLRDLPQFQGINTFGNFIVDRGYVNRGQSIDRARDFIATSGFKQLCVNVNGRDECGFGKVSTSYALNTLSESFVAEQITTGIKTEGECVAGTPSFGSLINPNIQEGISDLINPQLYNQGIIRVCATNNPGKQVLPSGEYDKTDSTYDRWKIVGYCDDSTIKCWLDTSSVKAVIRDKQLEAQILNQVNASNINKVNLWTYEQSRSVADRAEDFINKLKISNEDTKDSIDLKIRNVVIDLRRLTQLGTTNVHRARAHYLLGKLYKKITEELWKGKTDEDKKIYDNIIIDSPTIIQPQSEQLEEPQISKPSDINDNKNGKIEKTQYKVDNKNRIIDENNNFIELFFQETPNGKYQYVIKNRHGIILGAVHNGKVILLIDPDKDEFLSGGSEGIKKLNGLSYDLQSKSFYKLN